MNATRMVIACVVTTAIGACTPPQPEDGETTVERSPAFPCAERRQGQITPPATGVRLWYERTGPASAPALVLLNGSDANAALWSDGFVAPFVNAGYQVIRYDARDNGRSQWLPWPDGFDFETWTPDDPPPYPLEAHVTDLIGLLDALALDRVHLMGLSMGGMTAQMMAIAHPERVATLVLLSTSPSNSFDADLGSADPAFFASLADGWRRMGWLSMLQTLTRRPLAAEMTDVFLKFAHAPDDADRGAVRKLVDDLLAHAPHNPRSAQGFAIASSPSRVADLGKIDAPTLIIHGVHDAMFPLSHAVALAAGIPGSRLITIPGLGHGLPVAAFRDYRADMLQTMAQMPDPAPLPAAGCPAPAGVPGA